MHHYSEPDKLEKKFKRSEVVPSPIGHILSGILLFQIFNRHDARYDVRKLFIYIIISVIPDIDLAIGFLINDLKFHQGVFHSLGAAIIAGLIAGIVQMQKKGLFFKIFLDIWKGTSNETFFSGMFNLHNLWAIMIEFALFLPLIIIFHCIIFRKYRLRTF